MTAIITLNRLEEHPVGIGHKMRNAAPEAYELLGNYPNPFNNATRIHFRCPAGKGSIWRYIMSAGILIDRLLDRTMPAGEHTITGIRVYQFRYLLLPVYLTEPQVGSERPFI